MAEKGVAPIAQLQPIYLVGRHRLSRGWFVCRARHLQNIKFDVASVQFGNRFISSFGQGQEALHGLCAHCFYVVCRCQTLHHLRTRLTRPRRLDDKIAVVSQGKSTWMALLIVYTWYMIDCALGDTL